MLVNKFNRNKTIKEHSDEENARADIERSKAYIEYIAMMTDVEIPTDGETEDFEDE